MLLMSRGGARRLLLIAAGLLLCSLAHAQQTPATVSGSILGVDGAPRPYVSLDILGAERVYTETNDQGEFEVDLPPGRYVFRVRDGRRRMEFERPVGAEDTQLELPVTW